MENRPIYNKPTRPTSKKHLGVLVCFLPGGLAFGWIFGFFFPKGSYERITFYQGYRIVLYVILALFAVGAIISLIL